MDENLQKSIIRYRARALKSNAWSIRLENGEIVQVNFEAWYFGEPKIMLAGEHHFEFHGKAISETGYRSHFVSDDQLYNAMPLEVAKILAEMFSKEKKIVIIKTETLSLF